MDYRNHIKLISEETSIHLEHFWNFFGDDLEEPCQNTYQYVQDHLNTIADLYGREPAHVFFYIEEDDEGINAYADYIDGNYLIGINDTLINFLKENFLLRTESLEGSLSIREFWEVAEEIEIPLELMLFQAAVIFCFYHEFGHHIQEQDGQNEKRREYMWDSEQNTFDINDHISEADADTYAAKMMGELAINVWLNKSSERDQEILSQLVAIILAAIGYFLFRLEGVNPVYTQSYTHPHSLVRIFLVLDHTVGYVNHKVKRLGYNVTLENLAKPSIDLIKNLTEALWGKAMTEKLMNVISFGTKAAGDYAEELLGQIKRMPRSAYNISNEVANKREST